MCQKKVDEVLEFSEDIVSSFVEVPAPDNFRNYLFPAAAASSHQTLENVAEELRSISESVAGYMTSLLTIHLTTIFSALPVPTIHALPHTAQHFADFERCLPIADASMQRTYVKLRGLVQPLDQPNDPNRGVLRNMTLRQLKEEHDAQRHLGGQWANQL
jgi:hypothetical protein